MSAAPPRLQPTPAPRPGIGIVHLGLGAFFRAHVAHYLADSMAASGGDWGVVGVSLRRPDARDRLVPQGCAYSAIELAPDGARRRVFTLIRDVLVAPEDPGAVIVRLADPQVRLVTLTVTEKGYCLDRANGRLDLAHPDIRHDLATPDAPRSVPGFLVAGLARRRAAGLRPFTVLSCDNLPGNGPLLRAAVLDFAREGDPDLAAWIDAEGRFPSTMVDRIVPATGPGDIARLAARYGVEDAAPVQHEPFRQWVVEDDFVDGARPDLGAAGAELVADVTPFEHMKLRCLNGAHSSLAYLGALAGHETIAEAVADPAFAGFLHRLWHGEVLPGLTAPPGVDLTGYCAALLQRFANPEIRHHTAQIAMDGSQKLPQRLLAPLAENRAAGRPSAALTLAVAGWMQHVATAPELHDPLAERLRAAAKGGIAGFLDLHEVIPAALRADAGFARDLADALATLDRLGAAGAVSALAPSRLP